MGVILAYAEAEAIYEEIFFFKQNNYKIILLLLFFIFVFSGCSPCDSKIPDSKNNRSGFKTHFKITPGSDVTGVYFFADEWGGDAAYWFAFSAPLSVIEKIIENFDLSPKPYLCDEGWNTAVEDFPWWNLEERKQSDLYEFRDDKKEIFRQLWYNPKTQKCQVAIIYW